MDLRQIAMLRKGRFGWHRGQPMTMLREAALPAGAGAGWRKLAAAVLAAASLGLPINHVGSYALLLIATLVIFTGEVSDRMAIDRMSHAKL